MAIIYSLQPLPGETKEEFIARGGGTIGPETVSGLPTVDIVMDPYVAHVPGYGIIEEMAEYEPAPRPEPAPEVYEATQVPGFPGDEEVLQAGFLPAIGGLSLLDIWSTTQTVMDIFDTVQSVGGESQVSNGVDLYGHEGVVKNGGMIWVGGPGVPEPRKELVAKQWKTKAFSHTAGEYWVHFFKLIDGRMMCYNAAKREWKMWRPKKPIVLYRGKITLSQAVKTQRMLDKLWRTVAKKTKALKLA